MIRNCLNNVTQFTYTAYLKNVTLLLNLHINTKSQTNEKK